jgi:hypothetical protein
MYTTEVTIRDPLSGESVTTAGTLLVGIGQDMKIANTSTPLNATLEKRIIKPGEQIRANMAPKYGKWDSTLV